VLLSRLASAIECIKTWPEASGDDASVHVERTSALIRAVREVIAALQRAETDVRDDPSLRASLLECRIPLDLLDLMDSNLNPDCFLRGMLRESLGQLAGLKRRKLALELLGAAVQGGLARKEAAAAAAALGTTQKRSAPANAEKRPRSEVADHPAAPPEDLGEPPSKKQYVEEALP
jgi:hypothetical protein